MIHAPRGAVWDALRREFAGETRWWLPELGFRPLGGATALAAGNEVEVVPMAGRARRPPLSFVARAVEVVEGERLVAEYRGAFEGTGRWELEPVEGGTRLRMRWNVRTRGLVPTALALVADLGKGHSEAMQAGFRRLEERLAGGRPSG